MLKVKEIAFSGYSVTDMPRARAFYEGVLGLKAEGIFANGGWIEYYLGPHTLSITNMAPTWKPSPNGGSIALEVENFDEAIAHLRANEVKFSVEPFDSPVCRMAIISDPDGNSVCIHRRNDG